MAYKLWISLLLISLSFATIPEENDVWVLNESNFKEALEIQPDLLVFFYAPWCQNSKKLAPVYANVAKNLKARDPSVRIAKVDGTRNSNLASIHGVEGYPTLKYFVNKIATKYTGNQTEEGIVSWVWKRAGPATIVIDDLSELKKQIENSKIAIILFSQKKSYEAGIFEKAAKQFEDQLSFFLSTDHKALKDYGVIEPSVILFKRYDEEEYRLEGKFTQAKLNKLIEENKTPLLKKFDEAGIKYIFHEKHPCVFLFRFENQTQYDQIISKAGKEFKDEIAFSYADISLDGDTKKLGEYLKFDVKDMPTVVIVEFKDGPIRYRLSEEISESSIKTFIKDWKNHTLIPYLKSEPIPENDFDGNVRVLVGKNYESVVNDTTKDVLVEFYAPWCGHCQTFASEYARLAGELKNNTDITIAKIDGSANEIEGINISSFPTFKWYPKNDKKGIDYSGERKFDDILRFVTGIEPEKTTEETTEKTSEETTEKKTEETTEKAVEETAEKTPEAIEKTTEKTDL